MTSTSNRATTLFRSNSGDPSTTTGSVTGVVNVSLDLGLKKSLYHTECPSLDCAKESLKFLKRPLYRVNQHLRSYQMEQSVNLCEILVREMKSLEFSQRSIDCVKETVMFRQAESLEPVMQRSNLTMVINSIFNKGPSVVPYQIRLGLCMSTDVFGWITDLKLLLLPFLKANEESFFV